MKQQAMNKLKCKNKITIYNKISGNVKAKDSLNNNRN